MNAARQGSPADVTKFAYANLAPRLSLGVGRHLMNRWMEMPNKYVVVSGALFGVIAVLQAVRALNQWPVQVGGFDVPVWASWVAMVVAGGLCVWAFRSRHK
jgi:hypothetical protein